MPKIFIEMIEGRSIEQKRKLVLNLTDAVVDALGVKPDTVSINIHENTKENLAKGGKLLSDN